MRTARVRSATIVVSAVCALSLAACSSDDSSSDTTADTTSAPTTAPAPEPTAGVTGLVWASAVSDDRINTDTPQPTFEANGITSRVESMFWVESGGRDGLQSECDEAADFEQEFVGGELATECLMVQWAFDVSPDFRTDENSEQSGRLRGPSLLTPEGRQLDEPLGEQGSPGTAENRLRVRFVGGVSGSTLRFETGSNLVGWTTHVYEVPPAEEFLPVFLAD